RGLTLLGRPLPRVLNGQRGRDDQHLTDAALTVGLQHHPSHARVDGQLREFLAGRSEPLVLPTAVERTDFGQQLVTCRDLSAVRRIEEGEPRDVPESQRRHLQNDRGEIGPQNLRAGELLAGLEILWRLQPNTDALGNPATPSLALVRRSL